LTTVFDALSVLAFVLTVITLVFEIRLKQQSIGFFVFPVVFVLQGISFFDTGVVQLFENINETIFTLPLFYFHTLTTVIGYSFFLYSMLIGIMYLRLFKELKQKSFHRGYDKMPPLRLLEKMNRVGLLVGFGFLSAGIVSGSIMAARILHQFPFTDPKIILSLILWIIYLFGLVMHLGRKWSGRKMAFVSIVGSVVMVFSVFVVNFLFPTFHRF
jgi:ABC-type uncharacterized transport system permease subunit